MTLWLGAPQGMSPCYVAPCGSGDIIVLVYQGILQEQAIKDL